MLAKNFNIYKIDISTNIGHRGFCRLYNYKLHTIRCYVFQKCISVLVELRLII